MDNFNDIEFVHFDNNSILENFILFIKDINIQISHTCCNGKGLGIFKNNIDVNKIVFDFLNQHNENKYLIDTITDYCCVCKEKTNTALNCIKPHHLCIDCFQHIKNECPYCRRTFL